jgi:glycosyltransferase involved in cell wall biosynthesis
MQMGTQTVLAALCGMVLRKPFVALTTSNGPLGEVSALRNGLAGRLKAWALRRANAVIVQTVEAADELKGLVEPSRVHVMYNPVTTVAASPLNNELRALYMGRLTEGKDLPNLLSAWALIASTRPDAELVLLGEGGHYQSVEQLLRQTLEDDQVLKRSVTIQGWVSDPLPYLVRADVFVFPSLSEGMSNSLLEACAAGRVVVASSIPSNRMILGADYPLLFPAGDREALISCLAVALHNGEARAAAVAQIAGRLALFSPEKIGDQFEGILIGAQDCTRDLRTSRRWWG